MLSCQSSENMLKKREIMMACYQCWREVPFREGGDESPQIIYIPSEVHFFVGDAYGTEVSVKGFRAGVTRCCEGTVGEAPSMREE